MDQQSVNAGVQRGQVGHGARVYLRINGKKVGYMTSVDGGENIEFQPVEVLDNLEVVEHVPVRYTVNLSASRVFLVNASLKKAGIFESVRGILSRQVFTLEVVDRVEGKVIQTFEGVRASSNSWSFEKGQISFNRMEFVAQRIRDVEGIN